MDHKSADLEALRSKLKAMPRKVFMAIAAQANIAPSTAEKIRHGHIADPAFSKVEALAKAVLLHEKSQSRKRTTPAL